MYKVVKYKTRRRFGLKRNENSSIFNQHAREQTNRDMFGVRDNRSAGATKRNAKEGTGGGGGEGGTRFRPIAWNATVYFKDNKREFFPRTVRKTTRLTSVFLIAFGLRLYTHARAQLYELSTIFNGKNSTPRMTTTYVLFVGQSTLLKNPNTTTKRLIIDTRITYVQIRI